MTSSKGNIFRVTGPLWGESTGHRWIPPIKVSDVVYYMQGNKGDCKIWPVFESMKDNYISNYVGPIVALIEINLSIYR